MTTIESARYRWARLAVLASAHERFQRAIRTPALARPTGELANADADHARALDSALAAGCAAESISLVIGGTR